MKSESELNPRERRGRRVALSLLVILCVVGLVVTAPLWPVVLEEFIYAKSYGHELVGARWLERVEVRNRLTGADRTWVIFRDTGERVIDCPLGDLRSWRRIQGGVIFHMRDGSQVKFMRPHLLPTYWGRKKAPLIEER